MATLLFRLRGVPEDEAADVRRLLGENGIDYYETTAGNWGIAMPGIWLHDDTRLGQARELLDAYQKQRQQAARQAWQDAVDRGEKRTVLTMIAEAPLRVTLLVAALLLVIYLSLMPFLHLH